MCTSRLHFLEKLRVFVSLLSQAMEYMLCLGCVYSYRADKHGFAQASTETRRFPLCISRSMFGFWTVVQTLSCRLPHAACNIGYGRLRLLPDSSFTSNGTTKYDMASLNYLSFCRLLSSTSFCTFLPPTTVYFLCL